MLRKSQAFSLDLIVATFLLTLALGSIIFYLDLLQRKERDSFEIFSNKPETIISGFFENISAFDSSLDFCWRYSNGTTGKEARNCDRFFCSRNVLTYGQLTVCKTADIENVCLLEVRTCG